MNLETYAIEALRTAPENHTRDQQIMHAQLGIVSEIGELAGDFKDHLVYGAELNQGNVDIELGDIIWFVNLDVEAHGLVLAGSEGVLLAASFGAVVWVGQGIWVGAGIAEMLSRAAAAFIKDPTQCNLDVLLAAWLIAVEVLGSRPYEEILDMNIAKLKARFPDKFSGEQAINRDLEAEAAAVAKLG